MGEDCRIDAAGRDVACTDTQGDSTITLYDANGNVVQTIDGVGTAALGGPASVVGSGGTTVIASHPTAPLPDDSTLGATTCTFDARDRKIRCRDRLNGHNPGAGGQLSDVDYLYDDNDNLVAITDNEEGVTTYVYDFGWHRLLVFAPWLVWKIASANLQVAMLVLRPDMPIDPRIIRVRIDLDKDVSRMAMAAAITLTPGTCVLDINGEEFVIHCIHPSSAEDIHSGAMLEVVRWTFEPGSRSSEATASSDEEQAHA